MSWHSLFVCMFVITLVSGGFVCAQSNQTSYTYSPGIDYARDAVCTERSRSKVTAMNKPPDAVVVL